MSDLNSDGDVQYFGEAQIWFGANNESKLTIKTPNSIAQESSGDIYISYAGPSLVYRTKDLKYDGETMDVGEATIWFDFNTIGLSGIPFCLTFDGQVGILSDLSRPTEGAILRLEDWNCNEVIEHSEARSLAAKG